MNAESTKTVQQFVNEHHITMTAEYADRNPNMADDKWQADHWKVVLTRRDTEVYSFHNERGDLVNGHKDIRRTMTTYYSMGTGHHGREPEAAEVLSSLASDASSIENAEGFEDWASEFGYDTDSRKAERTYKACKRIADRLKKFLGDDACQELLYHVEPL